MQLVIPNDRRLDDAPPNLAPGENLLHACAFLKGTTMAVSETSLATATIERYSRGAIMFHWAMFVLVVCVGVLGLLHDSWPKRTQSFWINIHALLGLLLWSALIARFWWRRWHAPPAPMANTGALWRRLAGLVHFALDLLM